MKRSHADILIVLVVLGGAWYLYTRSRGLNVLGQYDNTMLRPAQTGNSTSPVVATSTTSTWATNAISALLKGIQQITSSIAHAPGNANTRPAAPYNGTAIGEQTGNGTATGASFIGSELPAPDPTLDTGIPFWSMFDVPPPTPDYSSIAWTVRPEDSYIPPPPGTDYGETD